jgi:hypothetical protein
MKKIIHLTAIFIFMLSLIGCVSEEQKAEGKKELKIGKPLIKQYVKNTYGKKAKVTNIKPYYVRESSDSTVPNFQKIAAGYVKGTVSLSDTKFDMLYDIYRDEVLTKENIGAVEQSFCSYASDVLPFSRFVDCQMAVREKDVTDAADISLGGFLKPDTKTYRDLVANERRSVELIFQSIAGDLKQIPEEQWQQLLAPFQVADKDTETDASGDDELTMGSHVSMLFIDYKDKEAYEAQKDQNYFNYIDSTTPYYASDRPTPYVKSIVYGDYRGHLEFYKGQ